MSQSIEQALDKGVYHCPKCDKRRGWCLMKCKYVNGGPMLTNVSCGCKDKLDEIDSFPGAVQYVWSEHKGIPKGKQ
jgi:hypothetical protein